MDCPKLVKGDKALFQEDDLLCIVKIMDVTHNRDLYRFSIRIIKVIRNSTFIRKDILPGSKLYVARHRLLDDIFASWTMTKLKQYGNFVCNAGEYQS